LVPARKPSASHVDLLVVGEVHLPGPANHDRRLPPLGVERGLSSVKHSLEPLHHRGRFGPVRAVQLSIFGSTSQGNFTWTATPAVPLTVNLDTLLIFCRDCVSAPSRLR
jgi:hypothetical protein